MWEALQALWRMTDIYWLAVYHERGIFKNYKKLSKEVVILGLPVLVQNIHQMFSPVPGTLLQARAGKITDGTNLQRSRICAIQGRSNNSSIFYSFVRSKARHHHVINNEKIHFTVTRAWDRSTPILLIFVFLQFLRNSNPKSLSLGFYNPKNPQQPKIVTPDRVGKMLFPATTKNQF